MAFSRLVEITGGLVYMEIDVVLLLGVEASNKTLWFVYIPTIVSFIIALITLYVIP